MSGVIRIEGFQRPQPERAALVARWNSVCPEADVEIKKLASRHPNALTVPFAEGKPAKHVVWKIGDFTHTLSLMVNMTGSRDLYVTGGLARLDLVEMQRLSADTPFLTLRAPFNQTDIREAIITTERALCTARFVILGQTNVFRLTREPIRRKLE